jgi:hypothetical protein
LITVFLQACDYSERTKGAPIEAGTVRAVESCIADNLSELIEEKVIRRLCIEKHEQPLDAEYICDFYSAPQPEINCYAFFASSDGRLKLKGTIHNNSADFVLTRYSVGIVSGHEKLKKSKEFTEKWIQPRGSDDFEIPFEAKRRIDLAEASRLNDMDWQIRLYDLQAIRVDVK